MKDRVIDWWRRRRWTKARYSRLAYFSGRSEAPELPSRRTLAIVGSPDRPKWAVFACPCGYGHSIVVNLSSTRRPAWRLRVEEGGPSLHPSVDSLTDGRRCHFWLRVGRVHWATDDYVSAQEMFRADPIKREIDKKARKDLP